MRAFLVTYADGGEVHRQNQRALLRSAANKGLDVLLAYGRADLPATFVSRHRHILDQPRGAGYWLWKPYLIRECLDRAAADDVVVYLDSGMLIRRSLRPILEQTERDGLLLMRNAHANAPYVKRDCFVLTGTDMPDCHEARQVSASFMAIRNTEANRRFVDAWLELCTDDRILTDQPNQCGRPNLPGFVAHRHDQAVLSVLSWRERERLPQGFIPRVVRDRYVFHHRRRTTRVPILVWHWTPRPIRNAAVRGWLAVARRIGSLARR